MTSAQELQPAEVKTSMTFFPLYELSEMVWPEVVGQTEARSAGNLRWDRAPSPLPVHRCLSMFACPVCPWRRCGTGRKFSFQAR